MNEQIKRLKQAKLQAIINSFRSYSISVHKEHEGIFEQYEATVIIEKNGFVNVYRIHRYPIHDIDAIIRYHLRLVEVVKKRKYADGDIMLVRRY